MADPSKQVETDNMINAAVYQAIHGSPPANPSEKPLVTDDMYRAAFQQAKAETFSDIASAASAVGSAASTVGRIVLRPIIAGVELIQGALESKCPPTKIELLGTALNEEAARLVGELKRSHKGSGIEDKQAIGLIEEELVERFGAQAGDADVLEGQLRDMARGRVELQVQRLKERTGDH
ncbi:hypothetical protein HDV00_011018 [Rhizophlyctis rosea]|nr:hypothetical protein HDV00_011018 [Rhizophlyctis rosea]